MSEQELIARVQSWRIRARLSRFPPRRTSVDASILHLLNRTLLPWLLTIFALFLFMPSGTIAGPTVFTATDTNVTDPFSDYHNPNPYVAFLPAGLEPNYALWRPRLVARAQARAIQLAINQTDQRATVTTITEQEPNNTPATANILSGFGTGTGQQRTEEIHGALPQGDPIDYYRLELTAGDILGLNLTGAIQELALYDDAGMLLIESTHDASGSLPFTSPLPGGGSVSLYTVMDASGSYILGVSNGSGSYRVQVNVFRPALGDTARHNRQILFVDFDGQTLNASIVWGPNEERTLSPLRDFLPEWSLSTNDESAVIDAILAVLAENLAADIGGSLGRGANGDYLITGIPGEFAIQIFNSRDHADPFGQPHVSRVIIGGTRNQLGLNTIGISQSIDVGNFDTAETSVLLLDLLSAPASNQNSLNRYSLAAGAAKIDLVGVGVGNIAAHEAGHLFGNFHTENSVTPPNIMDRGGNMPNIIGVGPDTIFGNSNDIDVDLGLDSYSPGEWFSGLEDTLNTIAFGLSTGSGPGLFLNLETGALFYTGRDDAPDTVTIQSGATVTTPTALMIDDGTPQSFSSVKRLTIETGNGNDTLIIGNLASVEELSQLTVALGTGNDQLELQPAPQVAMTVDGGTHESGDTMRYDAQSLTTHETSNRITSHGMAAVQHTNIEAIDVVNAPLTLPLRLHVTPLVHPGAPITLTLSFTNSSALIARDITFNLTIPPAISELGVVVKNPGTLHHDAALTQWQLATLPPGSVGTITLTGRVDPAITAAQAITTTATVNVARQTLLSPTQQMATTQIAIPVTISAGGPYRVDEGGTLQLTASSNPANLSLEWAWDLDADGPFDDVTGPQPTLNAKTLDGPATLTVRVRARNGGGDLFTASATVTITNVPPTANAGGPYRIDEGGVLQLSATGQDVAADELTFAWDWDHDGHFEDGAGPTPVLDGSNLDGPATLPLRLMVSDDDGAHAMAITNLTVHNVAPHAADDYATTRVETPVTLDVLRNDRDPGQDVLTIATIGKPTHGVASLQENRVHYVPTTGYLGPDQMTYTIEDGDGGSALATIFITVTDAVSVNHAPLARNDSATVPQDTSITIHVLENDSDLDGDELVISAVGAPTHGVAATNGTVITYTAGAGFQGSDLFDYTADDGRGGKSSATVLVVISSTLSPQTGTVSGVVFVDANGNGEPDSAEERVAQVAVSLDLVSGQSYAAVNTTVDGLYDFRQIPPGNYMIRFTLPPGYTSTAPREVQITVAPITIVTASLAVHRNGTTQVLLPLIRR